MRHGSPVCSRLQNSFCSPSRISHSDFPGHCSGNIFRIMWRVSRYSLEKRERLIWFIWFVSFISLVLFNQAHETNKTNPLTVF